MRVATDTEGEGRIKTVVFILITVAVAAFVAVLVLEFESGAGHELVLLDSLVLGEEVVPEEVGVILPTRLVWSLECSSHISLNRRRTQVKEVQEDVSVFLVVGVERGLVVLHLAINLVHVFASIRHIFTDRSVIVIACTIELE